jgi:hypothetical protein
VECFKRALGIIPKYRFVVLDELSKFQWEALNSYRSSIFNMEFVGFDRNMHNKDGLNVLEKWGIEAYPFTEERNEQFQCEAI